MSHTPVLDQTITLANFGALPPSLNVPQAARVLNVSPSTAWKGVHDGTIPHVRVGHRVLIPTAALRRLLSVDADR